MCLRSSFLLLLIVVLGLTAANAQRIVGQDTLYGNEWLVEGQEYWKLRVGEDQISRVTGADLAAAGVELSSIDPNEFTVYAFGVKQAVLVEQLSTGTFSETDAFVFITEKNKSQFDQWLVSSQDDLLHVNQSLYSDTATYYLTFEQGVHPRFSQASAVSDQATLTTSLTTQVVKNWTSGFINPNEQRYVFRSNYTADEGFSSGLRENLTYTQQLPNWVSGTIAEIEVSLVGSNDVNHNFSVSLNGNSVVQDSFFGSERKKYDLELLNDASSTSFQISHQGGNNTDRLAFGEILVKYRRDGVAGIPRFMLGIAESNFDQKLYFNFPANSSLRPYALAKSQYQSLTIQRNLDSASVHLPSALSLSEIVIGTSSSPNALSSWVYSPQRLNEEVDYIMLTSNKLSDSGSTIDDYISYRSSNTGGNHEVLKLEVEDLYDQFGFGIDNHPQAIRNAIHFFNTSLPDLSYLFILGKGRTYDQVRTPSQLSGAANFFVPTYGYPASDYSFSCWPGTLVPTLSTARFPAENIAEVQNYLNKVRITEQDLLNPSSEDLIWRQRFLHLGGGNSASQQARIKGRLEQFAEELKSSAKSGEDFAAYRISDQPVETSQLDEIYGAINDGVGLVNFYGHSSQGVLGFNIDNSDRYQNSQKLPVFFAMGCLAGDIHRSGKGISERFVNQRNTGMVFAGASLSESFESDAGILIDDVYHYWSQPWSGDPTIGRVVTDALNRYGSRGQSDRIGYVTEQFQLIGDPGLQLYSPSTPDYTWDETKVSVSPQLVDPSIQVVTVNADLYNLGRRVGDSVMVVLSRVFPKGGQTHDTLYVQDPGFRTTLSWEVPSMTDSVGQHHFYLQVDPLNLISEQVQVSSETNNTFNSDLSEDIGFTAISNAAEAIFPPSLALTGCPLELLGVSSNPLAENRDYLFQISEDSKFSSIRNEGRVTQAGGVIPWNPGQLDEGETYFWRIAPIQGDSLIARYSISSFTCSSSNSGVAFSDPEHFRKPESSGALFIDSIDQWRFPRHRNEFEITNVNRQGSDFPRFTKNGGFVEANYGNDIRSGVYVAVFDTLNLDHLNNPAGGLYGTETPASWRTRHVFGFRTHDAANRREVVTFLDSIIPDRQYVGFWTIQGGSSVYDIADWASDSLIYGRTIFDALEDQGALRIRELEQTGEVPYIFTYRQNLEPLTEVVASQVSDTLRVELPVEGYWFEGSYSSSSLISVDSIRSVSLIVDDTRNLEELAFNWILTGVDSDGDIDTLYAGENLSVDLSDQISLDKAYALQANWSCLDTLSRKPVNVVGMQVGCSPLPELVWNHQARAAGEVSEAAYADSLIVTSELFNASLHEMPFSQLSATLRTESGYDVIDTVNIPKIPGLSGQSIRQKFINKTSVSENGIVRLIGNSPIQKGEGNFDNNLLALTVKLEPDLSIPSATILANGEQFIRGSLLPSTSSFVFRVSDNASIPNDVYDTWELRHTLPSGVVQILPISDQQFEVDDSTPDRIEVRWSPESLEDGLHLIAINIFDESGNSPRLLADQEFEIINETSLSEIIPYPNPATDNVRFFYELTGGNTLSDYQIDIYSISGRLVTSLGSSELGILRPGRNLTEFGWFPATPFGDRLAKGTYLYRFSAIDAEGNPIKEREAKINRFVKSGFGKLVLL